jgi:hypothetical protein
MDDYSLRYHHHRHQHTHQLHRKEMLGENQKNSTGVLPDGFFLVSIKVNSYSGALLFKQVLESFLKSKGVAR